MGSCAAWDFEKRSIDWILDDGVIARLQDGFEDEMVRIYGTGSDEDVLSLNCVHEVAVMVQCRDLLTQRR